MYVVTTVFRSLFLQWYCLVCVAVLYALIHSNTPPPCFIDAGGGSSYNWMTPSLQSLDPSFTMGTGGGTQSSSTSASESALLFSKMRPPKRPLRAIRPGEGFGKERLKPDETASLG